MSANLKKSDAAWKRLQDRRNGLHLPEDRRTVRAFANRADAAKRAAKRQARRAS